MSFAAFLWGSLVQVHPSSITSLVRKYERRFDRRITRGPLNRSTEDALEDWIRDFEQANVSTEMARFLEEDKGDRIGAYFNVISELKQLAVRLQVANMDLFTEYDRRASEADFRINVGLAVGALSSSLAYDSGNWWTLAGLGVTFIMLLNGMACERDSNDVLIQSLVANVIESTSLTRYKESIQVLDSVAASLSGRSPESDSIRTEHATNQPGDPQTEL
ncbi:hypothetical protein [Streptomyces spinosus]|uniref:hypothetical protein n=1 Tax=Streptomyces spinosus TaxID=2872623 RepID=UPI001CED4871|nr:hypothetical protein [Streptomyces spinosus]